MAVSTIPERRAASADHVRLLTHNIWGREGHWDDRRRALIDGLDELRPDLVALQETILTDVYDQAVDILGSGFRVVHSRVREENGSGITIGSRWPIANARELDLKVVSPRTDAFACTTLIAEIQAPPPVGPLLVVNHFPDYQVDHEVERERQTVIAARALEAMHAANARHVLWAGDLDAEPDAASLRFLSGKQSLDGISVCYRNAWDSAHPGEPGHTFTPLNPLAPADWPFRRIDHIFVRCGAHGGPTLRTSACELAFGEPIDGVWASDHFGLVADLALPSPSGARP
jgi:endonuclease/exonuclease/phosphatase family metal-dependent hydrolase